MLKQSFFILLIIFALGNFSFADQKDKWSISIGQFDVNDTIDSSELFVTRKSKFPEPSSARPISELSLLHV